MNEVLTDMQVAALFVDGSVVELEDACKAARRAGGSDDFSVIVLTGEQ